MNKHTPGKWVARDYDDGQLSVVIAGKVDYEIAAINRKRDEAEANARLIAAAPEMLEALLNLNEYCNHHPDQNCVHQRAAGKAIAKATVGEK